MEMDMPKFNFSFEQRMFGRYFKFSLGGKTDCTIWKYLIELYHFKYIETICIGIASLLVFLSLCFLIYYQIDTYVTSFLMVMSLVGVVTTVHYILDVKECRRKIMKYWESMNSGEKKND
jgi:hypothetical protein